MTCKINLLFFPYHNTGGHFIDWSLRYLCGQTDVDDAHFGKNWHHHKSFKAQGYQDLVKKIQRLQQDPARQFENIYLERLELSDAVHLVHGIDIGQSTHRQREQARDHEKEDTKKMLYWAQQACIIPVILDYHAPDWYSQHYCNRNVVDLYQQPLPDQQQVFDQYLSIFYPSTTEKFTQDYVWDRREMLSLIWNFDPPDCELQTWYDHQQPHLYYNTDDVWNNLPAVIEEIGEVLGLELLREKFEIWKTIYQQWRLVHDPYFGRHLGRIIDAIIHNKYLSLRRFRMNFWHEVIIQNQLIHKHNLNLRTWQLEKFPDNTQDLHQLLEPNCHVL